MKENRIRWRILDKLLGSEIPVSSADIFSEWERSGLSKRYGTEGKTTQEQYEITLRQDLFKFKKIYKEAGHSGPLLVESVCEEDKRRRTYRYADPGFSIMPLIGEKYTKANWKSIDDALAQLYQLIPDELAEQINFFVNGRIDCFRGEGATVDWSDNPQLLGYSMLPRLYRYVKSRQPFSVSFTLFGQPTEQFITHPYLLKEYQGRWYCLGFREDKKMLWPISVDRIKQGSIIPADVPFKEFDSASCSSAADYFSNVIGVTKEYNEITKKDFLVTKEEQEITLKVTSETEWMYLITNPIHRSQQIISDYDAVANEGKLSFKVICNIEMYRTILSRGTHIQIESPDFAREIIKAMISELYAGYNG